MPALDSDRLDPDMPGFEFGRFLFARPAGDTAVCLFQQADDLLLLVGYDGDETGYSVASDIADPGAQTVSDARHWALAGPLESGERVREAFLVDGTQLVVSQKPGAWLAIVDPLEASTAATIVFGGRRGVREQTFVLREGSGEAAWPARTSS